jgi:hypothetical protein
MTCAEGKIAVIQNDFILRSGSTNWTRDTSDSCHIFQQGSPPGPTDPKLCTFPNNYTAACCMARDDDCTFIRDRFIANMTERCSGKSACEDWPANWIDINQHDYRTHGGNVTCPGLQFHADHTRYITPRAQTQYACIPGKVILCQICSIQL